MSDNLTPEQRRLCMSRVRGKDTRIEQLVRSELHKRGLRFRKHVKELPGRPDVVFSSAKVAVFIDGDFWHGYRFGRWREDLSVFWQKKIEGNRSRDKRNFRKLRRMGWRVIRLWQHEIEDKLEKCIERVEGIVRAAYPIRVSASADYNELTPSAQADIQSSPDQPTPQ